jgi:hypothetical protein
VSETERLERAHSLVNEAMFVVSLQRRRLQTTEPEDNEFLGRIWADWEFFVVALSRLRRRAAIVRDVPEVASALSQFDRVLPHLKTLRDVAEHIDAYAVDHPKRHDPSVSRRQISVGAFNADSFQMHLGADHIRLEADAALEAAARVDRAVRNAIGR